MINGTILWLALPFFVGFTVYLLPGTARLLTLGVTLVSLAYAMALFGQPAPLDLHLLDSFGVTLLADDLSAYFILTNALVTAAVILYCWDTSKTAFFYTQAIILH
ncbi:MAG: cation:proton antiporter, partial [Leptolyngbya sp.]